MNDNSNMQIPMVVAKEREQDTCKLNIVQEKIESNPKDEIKVKINSSSASSSNGIITTNTNENFNLKTQAVNSTKSNNLSSSISTLLTQDVLNSIDLHTNLINKQNNVTPLSTNKTSSTNVNYTKKFNKDSKNNSGNRNIMSGLDKRLASESIEYEPVFK